MKKVLLFIILFFSLTQSFASHIVGGEVFYEYQGIGSAPNTSKYLVTVRLFTECGQACGGNSGVACPPPGVIVSIFNNAPPYTRVADVALGNSGQPQLNLSTYPDCIDNKPTVCYQVNVYTQTVELTNTAEGYRLAYQSCCRADAINVFPNAPSVNGEPGAAYEATIPGTNLLPSGHNSTAVVNLKDTILICYNSYFSLPFSSLDPDNDILSYEFVSAYNGGSHTASDDTPADGPLYGVVTYQSPYSGASPLGSGVTINPVTGVISGLSPSTPGKYVVNVIVKEWRNGIVIAEHRKDFLIKVNQCNIPQAVLDISHSTCNGLDVNFEELSHNPLNVSFDWLFDDPTSGTLNISNTEFPTHHFSAPGDYNVRLIVNAGTPCADTAFSLQRVWPGFYPAIKPIPATCKDIPINFTDLSTTDHPAINYWHWDFGIAELSDDTSINQNPTYIYHTSGDYPVQLIVASDKGCRDTAEMILKIVDKPDFHVPNDTLICIVDTLQLIATTTSISGTVTWSPNYMISDIHSLTPLVSPDVTTTYTAFFIEPSGCNDTKTVTVNVTSGVSFTVGIDTTICRTDSIILRIPSSNALYYNWTAAPATTISDPSVRNPSATPSAPLTVFHVKASISAKCFAENEIKVKTVPYPVAAIIGSDPICFGSNDTLQASGGSSYSWSPVTYLSNPNIADPIVVQPKITAIYTVTVRDILGCPKPVTKDFTVHVIKVIANAGPQDTSVVLGQPLLLTATGGSIYEWTPDTWLSNSHIFNPVSNPRNNITYNVKVSNSIGCFSNDTINVKVYFVLPDVYVPSAFTPGGDGLNDLFRPIALGIKSLENFRVYNRWGELVYSTKQIGEGWNGKYKGQGQNAGTYVWEVEATDYTGRKIRRKGSVILIK